MIFTLYVVRHAERPIIKYRIERICAYINHQRCDCYHILQVSLDFSTQFENQHVLFKDPLDFMLALACH